MKKTVGLKKAAAAVGMLALAAGWYGSASPVRAGDITPYIIGGNEVPRGKYPFMASVQVEGRHFCGGTLLGPGAIITAAHCVRGINDKNVNQFSITVGQTLLGDQVGSQRRGIFAIFISNANGSDLAVVYLDKPVEGIVPVALPTEGSDALYQPGQMATVMGWGNTDPDLPYYPDRLREVEVPILSVDECAVAYPGGDLSTYFCAGVRGKDSCQGDSGGPIIRIINGHVYQIGVVSFGTGCAQQGAPGVYANLSSGKLWNSLELVFVKNLESDG